MSDTTRDRTPPRATSPHTEAAQPRRDLARTPKGLPESQSERPPKLPHCGDVSESSLLTARDRQILTRLAQLRFLSYTQIHEHFFAQASLEATGQRMRELARRGWVILWKEPVVRGGRPNYVFPTRQGLKIGLDIALAGIHDTATRRLVRAMLPAKRRRPLVLEFGVRPPFLAHQREVNTLALRSSAAYGASVRWISSWDRPFRHAVYGVTLPQPDLVLVVEREGESRLAFLESDRGHESLAHFRAAKISNYAELAARPDILEQLTGFRSFVVGVSVLDVRFHRPLQRLKTLARATVELGADHLFLYSLAGWVATAPSASVWFAPDALPDSRSLSLGDQEASLLRSLFPNGAT